MPRVLNPLAPRREGIHGRMAEIKSWVRWTMGLPEEATVSVTELACQDEGCPDVETVIGVLESGRPIRTFRVHKPISETVREDVETALSFGISGSKNDEKAEI